MPLFFYPQMKKSMITLYHNPNCSKSRETLAILQASGAEIQIIDYLTSPLDGNTIRRLIADSGIDMTQAIRHDVAEYAELIEGKALTDEEIITLMVRYPRLLNRPFASGEKGTKFCRPPELVKELL